MYTNLRLQTIQLKKLFKTILIVAFITVALQSITSQENTPVFSNEVFLTDQVIQFGEENFLERIGLTKAENFNEEAPKYVPIDKKQTEMPLGLVLSGGAARAFAHIGVLKELEANGVYPDFLVVNSMGSLVALLYAAGLSPDHIEKVVSDYPMNFLFTPRFPLDGGLIDDYNMISAVYEILGDIDIKDLEIPIVVLAEDLVSRRTVAFMEGDFYSILSATIAMPIAFPPVRYNGMILVDGGTTNLVPVGTASEYTDRIITSASFSNSTGEYRDLISVISRSLDLAKTRKGIEEVKTIDTVLIRCDVEDISYMAFDRAKEISVRGQESTERSIDEIIKRGFHNTTTWTDERIQGLISKREELAQKHEQALVSYKKTNILTQNAFTGYVSGGFQMYSGSKDDYYLDNSDYLYLSQHAEIANVVGEIREYWDPWRGTGIDTRFDVSFFDFLVLENRAVFKWDGLFNEGFVKGFEGIYYYGKLNASFTNNGYIGVDPHVVWESFYLNENGLSIDMSKHFARFGAELYFGDFSITPYAFNENLSVFGFGIKNEFNINFTDSFFLSQKTSSRFPFNFSESISLFKNDGVRSSVTEGHFDYIIVTNNNLSYNIKTLGTLFDSVVFKNLELSAFCDYYKTDLHGVSVGGEIGLDVSAIGLVSFELSAYGGYDFMHKDDFWSFSIGGKL